MNKFTNAPFEYARNSAVEKLRAQFEVAAIPFQRFQGLNEIARSVSSASQVAKMFESDSLRAIREMNRQMTMSDNLRDSLTQISSASHAIRELMKNELSRPIYFKNDFLRSEMTDFDVYGDSVRQFQKSLSGLGKIPEYVASLQRHAFGGAAIQEIVKNSGWANSSLMAAEAARKSLDDHWEKIFDASAAVFDGGELEVEEVERVVETIAQTSADQKSLEEAVRQIIETIEAQQTPEMQIVLWIYFRKIMDWLVSGIVGAIMGYYAPAILGESPQVAQKIVQETARTAVGTSGLLSEYRYVSTGVLIVRQNPRAQSPGIARLSFGKAVKLIKKERDFALIHWTDEENELEISGWVFARYLSKFN